MQTKNSISLNRMEEIGQRLNFIYKGDPRIETYRRDAVMTGNPDAVAKPRDRQELDEILEWCYGNNVPVTVCGGRTSMTGASVAEGGVLITTDHFNKIIDVGTKNGRPYGVVEPGVIIGEFQKTVEGLGYYYPVAPTSCFDAFIGGTVATNATGEDFYRYGPTRNFVREISYLKIDGSTGTSARQTNPKISKGYGGYYLDGDEIDRLIGSEGTLSVTTRVVVDLLAGVPETFIILAPFASNMDALKFIAEINREEKRPRSLEFIDSYALSLMKTHKACPKFSEGIRALVYIKDETPTPPSPIKGEGDMEYWAERIKSEEAIVAVTEKQKAEIKALRHHIPATISETHERLERSGGGKVGADWWVPRDKMLKMMEEVYAESMPLRAIFTAFAHLGDGHPHADYLCRTPEEMKLASKLVIAQCRRAVSYGGGVAGEHGIGKIKRHLLPIQHSQETIAKMRRVKEEFDPKWLLGRGNIFIR